MQNVLLSITVENRILEWNSFLYFTGVSNLSIKQIKNDIKILCKYGQIISALIFGYLMINPPINKYQY